MAESHTHPLEPAPRPTRRKWGVVVVAVGAVLTVLAVAKHYAMGGLSDSEVSSGLDALSRGLRTDDEAAFESARAHFRKAASVSILDYYPAFLISSTRKITDLRSGKRKPADAREAVLDAIARGRLEEARRGLDAIGPPGDEARGYYQRLVDGLDRRLGPKQREPERQP